MYRTVLVQIDDSGDDRDVMAVAHTVVRGCEHLTTVGASDDLHGIAEDTSADLIIVGAPEQPPVVRVRHQDHARAVLHHAPCTVAVAPRGYADRAHLVTRMGIAYDGSRESHAALDQALDLASRHGAHLAARNVVQLPTYSDASAWHVLNPPDRMVAAARQSLGDLGIDDVSVVVGPVRRSLLAFSETVDVMFCGSRQFGAVRRIALGSTSDYLAHHCRCPLFITPTFGISSAQDEEATGFPRVARA